MSQDSPPTKHIYSMTLGYMCIHFKCWKYRFYIKMSKKSTVFGIKFKPVIKDTEMPLCMVALQGEQEESRINRKGV